MNQTTDKLEKKDKNPFSYNLILEYTLKTFILIVVIILMTFFIGDVFSKKLYVSDYSLPDLDLTHGLNNKEIKKTLVDKLEKIYFKAGSVRGNHSDIDGVENPYTIEFIGLHSNYYTLVSYVKQKFGILDGKISGTLFLEGETYCFKTRINDILISEGCIPFDSLTKQFAAIDSVLMLQALEMITLRDPYIAAMYHYKNKNYQVSRDLTLEILRKQPEEDTKKLALGTLANSYRELNQLQKSEATYKLCLQDFPDFHLAKWQYAQLLLNQNRYTEADSVLSDTHDERGCQVALLESKCLQNDAIGFKQIYDQFVSKFDTTNLSKRKALLACLENL